METLVLRICRKVPPVLLVRTSVRQQIISLFASNNEHPVNQGWGPRFHGTTVPAVNRWNCWNCLDLCQELELLFLISPGTGTAIPYFLVVTANYLVSFPINFPRNFENYGCVYQNLFEPVGFTHGGLEFGGVGGHA